MPSTIEDCLDYVLVWVLWIILWKFLYLKKRFGTLLLAIFLEEKVLDHGICACSDTVKQFSKVIIPVYTLISIPVDFCPSHHLQLSFLKFYHFNLHFSGDYVEQFFTYLFSYLKILSCELPVQGFSPTLLNSTCLCFLSLMRIL